MSSFLPDILALFFLASLIIRRLGVDLSFQPATYQLLTYILLLTIGLKGGLALTSEFTLGLIGNSLIVVLLGVVLTLVAMLVIKFFSPLNQADRVTLAAHYGSVSVGTFAVAISFLQLKNISYEAELNLYVALLELPSILVGLWWLNRKKSHTSLKTIFGHQSLVLLLIGLVIGALYGDIAQPMIKQLQPLFAVMLALYLIHMGAIAGGKFGQFGNNALFLISFAIFMPILAAMIGLGTSLLLGLSVGGATLLMTLAASASYIAVPAVFEQAQPQANVAQALVASLAITFSFNVIWGIPLYHHLANVAI
ncbi:sodium-dependent bicarbonate transport family permease [Reinekea thalattae]|uniref:Sodium-dependent bicarbonate transport family permease n=1 Tax=Reinekea thalattae TaxID=2593301 RepID=A0A5C8Z2C3_9GAMM|nr:sodium-dependent bicarbonate transport family permease [Reinekea thalattae]TXR51398.1 sodium-dependent bicarbonate transport family permease [Reinekea thalattae]